MKQALITGITGQDGGYLSKLLLDNGYRVYGLDRRTSTPTTERLHYLEVLDRITLLDGDVTDQGSMVRGRTQADDRMVPELGTAGGAADTGVCPIEASLRRGCCRPVQSKALTRGALRRPAPGWLPRPTPPLDTD